MSTRARLRIFAPVYVLAVAVVGGLVGAIQIGGSIEDFYVDRALPWLITAWIGAGFTSTWDMLAASAEASRAPRGVVAATGVLSAVVLLSMLGGISVLWEDPWIFGVAVWPGFRMAISWLRGRLGSDESSSVN